MCIYLLSKNPRAKAFLWEGCETPVGLSLFVQKLHKGNCGRILKTIQWKQYLFPAVYLVYLSLIPDVDDIQEIAIHWCPCFLFQSLNQGDGENSDLQVGLACPDKSAARGVKLQLLIFTNSLDRNVYEVFISALFSLLPLPFWKRIYIFLKSSVSQSWLESFPWRLHHLYWLNPSQFVSFKMIYIFSFDWAVRFFPVLQVSLWSMETLAAFPRVDAQQTLLC